MHTQVLWIKVVSFMRSSPVRFNTVVNSWNLPFYSSFPCSNQGQGGWEKRGGFWEWYLWEPYQADPIWDQADQGKGWRWRLSFTCKLQWNCIELKEDLLFFFRCSKAQTTTLTWSSPHPHLQCVGWRIWTLTAKRSTSSQVKACSFSAALVFRSNKCAV